MTTPVIASTAGTGSGTVTVSGTPVTVSIVAPTGVPYQTMPLAQISITGTGGTSILVGILTAATPAVVIQGDGAYLITKPQSSVAYGVDRS